MNGKLLIFNILGIEFDVQPESFGIFKNDENLFLLIGEFLFKENLVDGKILMNEIQINQVLENIPFKINKVLNSEIYFQNIDVLKEKSLKVKWLFTENDGDDDEEYEIFLMKE